MRNEPRAAARGPSGLLPRSMVAAVAIAAALVPGFLAGVKPGTHAPAGQDAARWAPEGRRPTADRLSLSADGSAVAEATARPDDVRCCEITALELLNDVIAEQERQVLVLRRLERQLMSNTLVDLDCGSADQ